MEVDSLLDFGTTQVYPSSSRLVKKLGLIFGEFVLLVHEYISSQKSVIWVNWIKSYKNFFKKITMLLLQVEKVLY